MDASNIYVSSSSLAWPSCTTNTIPSNDNHQSSTRKERNSPQAMVLNGLSLPLVQIAQQEGQQTPFQLASDGTSFAIENANLSVIFTPQPQTVLQKTSQTLTLNIVNPLPILSPTSPAGFMGANSGKSKSVGKHICGHCGRDCLKPSVLEKHIRSHTGERPFPCNICGVSFKTQSNLYKHRRTQTHVNNAKQSCDSDCGSCHEDKIYEQVGHNTSFDISSGMRDVCIDNNPVQESDNVPGNKEDVSILSSLRIHDKTHGDSDYSTQTIFSPGMPNLQKAVIDPKSTSSSRHGQLQRQHEASVDKQWDGTLSERKLKKCESTDSGYLSHSDSADLQMFAGSPLHSLSECSMESENMLGIGSGESEDKSSSSYKKNLEEHISMLISHNKVVVDNTHLDNVRPRKTALSKQGSIDLPMPYTFKDSFHFDIKSLDASRKKVTLCSTKSTFTPSEKNKPLFFHSVPTQISTTIENIILSRSNSLPFVESGKLKDKLTIHNIKSHGSGKQHLNASYGNLLLSNTATACTVDFSCSHPRGLVRQAAVDEMHIGIGSDATISGDIKEKKKVAVDQLSSKLNTASKKGGQKKSNMFSHEKWQMYGDESFKKFYQKMKKNDQVKKTKQENPESTGLINNKVCLKSACELEKSSENLSSMSVVSSPTSNLQLTSAMTIAGIGMNIPASTGNPPVTLNDESGGQGNQPETKLQSNLNISKDDINSLQNVLVNVPGSSTGVTDNSGTVVTENQQKVLSISSIHDFLDINYTDNYQSNEISPSDRKKPKVAQLKGEILYSVSLDIEEDSIEHQNKSVDDITDSGNITRMLGGEGSNKVVSCQLLSTIISHAEDSKQISAQSNKSRLFSPTIQPPLALKETLFSPRYLIKFRFTGASLNKSVLQSNQPAVSGSISKDTDLFNLHHPTFLENQPHKIQKHDSVISPFGKIGLNEECLSICCASKISQHLVQNKSLDTQKVRLNGTYPERRHTFRNHTVVTEGQRVEKALISKQINLKSTMVLSNSSTTSANEVTKLSQDQFLLDIIQPGQTCCKPLNATELLNLKNSLFSTTCTHSPSGICSVKVSFSTMNTEPKSTWCWLDRCLPFPAEQKEKSYSVYASLSSNTFKERRSEPNRRIENNMNHRTTFDDQSMISSLLMSVKEKDDVDKETDNGNYYPLVKKSSKMGTVMKSKHVKRSKDGTRGRSHCKMLQHRSSRILVQDQQHKKNIGPASLESGEVLLVSTNLELSDKEGSRTSIHHQPFQGNLGQGSEAKALLDSQMNEATISTAPAASEQMVTAEDNLSLSMEKMAHPEPPQSPSLLWQKSCSSVLQKGSQVQHKHLTGFPRQKHVKKILHRSKTIGHSLGDNPVGSTSNCTSSDSQPKLPVEAKDGTRRSSLQNMHSTDFYLAPKTSNSGSNPRSGTLSFSQTLQSENYGAPSGLQLHGFKTQKKINLEVIRKQTHVEYSDSDDEDRLYIEIE